MTVSFGFTQKPQSYIIEGLRGDLCAVRFWYSRRQFEEMKQLQIKNTWTAIVFFSKLESANEEVQKVSISSHDMRKGSSRHALDIQGGKSKSDSYSVKFLVEMNGESARLYMEEMVLQTGCLDGKDGINAVFSESVMRKMCSGYTNIPNNRNHQIIAHDAMDYGIGINEDQDSYDDMEDLEKMADQHFKGAEERNLDEINRNVTAFMGTPRLSSGLRQEGSTAGIIPIGQVFLLISSLTAIAFLQ